MQDEQKLISDDIWDRLMRMQSGGDIDDFDGVAELVRDVIRRERKIMKKGTRVKIYPLARPERAAEATVLLASSDGCALGVTFAGEKPDFLLGEELLIHPRTGRMTMMLHRNLLNGEPVGTWIEPVTDGHFEVELAL